MGKWDPAPGKRLEEWREAAGFSMDELAKRVSPPVSASTVNKLEKAEIEFTMGHARQFAPPLKKHPLAFFGGMPELEPGESRLVQIYRGLAEDDRDTVFKIADAIEQAKRRQNG
jgi:transcriptional regulator with XRE-family HTH domain